MTDLPDEAKKKEEELSWYQEQSKNYPFLNNIIGGLTVSTVGVIGGLVWLHLFSFFPWILSFFLFISLGYFIYQNRKLKGSNNQLLLGEGEVNQEINNQNQKLLKENNELREKIANPKILLEASIDTVTGLIAFYEKLEDSPYYPDKCLPAINSHLDFMGNGASKWTYRISEEILENAIKKIEGNNGKARFLILNPFSKHVKDEENRRKIIRSLRRLRDIRRLLSNKNSLEIKVFDHVPQFRLIFIDKRKLVIGHYGGENKGDSKNSPLLEFGDNSWSFYHAFCEYFDKQWNSIKKGVDWNKVDDYWRGLEDNYK